MGRKGALLATALAGVALAACGQASHSRTETTHATTTTTTTTISVSPGPSLVDFVGCASDGQQGPQPAPQGSSVAAAVDAATAAQLSYYSASDGEGVLAPKGWHCFGAYGSDGSVLMVAPGPVSSDDVLTSVTWPGASGDAVQVSWRSGDTSGRFEVAKAIGAFFPARRAFEQNVIAEGVEPPGDFPTGAAATDRLTVRSPNVVEYETPANAAGVGVSQSQLKPGADPIDGVAILEGQTPNLAFLAARLPPAQKALSAAIVAQLGADSAKASVTTETAPASSTPPPPPPPVISTSGGDPVSVVRAFYAALGNADGATASGLVIPEKRGAGPYAPAQIDRFYGGMSQPIRLLSATPAGDGAVQVRYSYVYQNGRGCNGAAVVQTAQRGGQTLISGIRASGC